MVKVAEVILQYSQWLLQTLWVRENEDHTKTLTPVSRAEQRNQES